MLGYEVVLGVCARTSEAGRALVHLSSKRFECCKLDGVKRLLVRIEGLLVDITPIGFKSTCSTVNSPLELKSASIKITVR